MKLQAFAIKDRALNAFMRPWFAQAIGQATRMFSDELNRKDSEMNKHPTDYDLYHIGAFDEETGNMEPGKDVKQIARGIDFINGAITNE